MSQAAHRPATCPPGSLDKPANAAAQTAPPTVATALAGRSTDNAVIRLRCGVQLTGGQCALPSRHDGDCSPTPDERVVAVTSKSTVLVPAIQLDGHVETLPPRGVGR